MGRSVALAPPRAAISLARVTSVPFVLSAIVAASALVRFAVALGRQTPAYFPDEYLYSELGRSISETGHPLVRGVNASFPALLQPVLTAPVWYLDDVATAYHAIQAINALVMSLAAVPVYLLARRVGTSTRIALLVALAAVAVPDLLYTGWILSEPFAYPLVALAALLAVRALEKPTAGAQIGFLAVSGLAAAARTQFIVLPLCYVAAAVVFFARTRGLGRAVRQTWIVGGVLLLGAAALVARGGSGIGSYSNVLSFDLPRAVFISNLETQWLSLLYAGGWILVPGAIMGLGLMLARPQTRAELAFAAFTTALVAALLVQASGWGEPTLMQERYTFYAVPLLAIAFGRLVTRGWPWPRVHALACGALLVVAATIPLSTYVAHFGNRHSVVLFAVARAEQLAGVGAGSLLFSVAAAGLAVAAAVLGLSKRSAWAILPVACVAWAVTGAAGASYEQSRSDSVRRSYLPGDPSWIDHAGVGDVALLYSPGHYYRDGLEALFWNRSVKTILLLPGAIQADAFVAGSATIGADGSLSVDGHPVRGPLLVDNRVAKLRLRDATLVGTSPGYDLWKPHGAAQLATYSVGWSRDRWLARRSFTVWAPRISGWLSFRAKGPAMGSRKLIVSTPSGRTEVRLTSRDSRAFRLRACGHGSWKAGLASDYLVLAGPAVDSLPVTEPVWRPDPAACTSS